MKHHFLPLRNAERFVIFTCGLRRRHDRETSCLPHTSASNDSGLLGIPSSQVAGSFHGFFAMKHFFGDGDVFFRGKQKSGTKILTKKPFPFCQKGSLPTSGRERPFLFPGRVSFVKWELGKGENLFNSGFFNKKPLT